MGQLTAFGLDVAGCQHRPTASVLFPNWVSKPHMSSSLHPTAVSIQPFSSRKPNEPSTPECCFSLQSLLKVHKVASDSEEPTHSEGTQGRSGSQKGCKGWWSRQGPRGEMAISLQINSFTRGRTGPCAQCLLWTALAERSQG